MLLSTLAVVKAMPADDYVGFTFFVGTMAMMAASVFFFLSMNTVEGKWRTSLLISGLITFIATDACGQGKFTVRLLIQA